MNATTREKTWIDFVGVINAAYRVYYNKKRGEDLNFDEVIKDIIDFLKGSISVYIFGKQILNPKTRILGLSDVIANADEIRQVSEQLYDIFCKWKEQVSMHEQQAKTQHFDRECLCAANLAVHVYGDNDLLLMDGWEDVSKTSDFRNIQFCSEMSGLKSGLYARENFGKTEYCYATAGSINTEDWQNNIYQVAGISDQYKESVFNAQKIKEIVDKKGGTLFFVGHSKGGGQATLNALVTGCRAIVFNPAGVSQASKDYFKECIQGNSARILSIITTNDPLNVLQDICKGKKYGEYEIPVTPEANRLYLPSNNIFCSHSIVEQYNALVKKLYTTDSTKLVAQCPESPTLQPKEPNAQQLEESGKQYSENKFWDKVKDVCLAAGIKVIYLALILYYVMMAETTTIGLKSMIVGALGYFILPLDLVPDCLPVMGYSDDLGALMACVKTVHSCITPAIKQQVSQRLQEWFGDYDTSEINDLI